MPDPAVPTQELHTRLCAAYRELREQMERIPSGALYVSRMEAKNGPAPLGDAMAMVWWLLDMIPVHEMLKYPFLTMTSLRLRLHHLAHVISTLFELRRAQ